VSTKTGPLPESCSSHVDQRWAGSSTL
jgi:hypothetical protein